METRKLMVVGTGSNVGKTTVTLGLMAAYKHLDYAVQGFKCGPDYIDPTYHSVITGRQSRNLDSWMCKEEVVKEIFADACQDADIAIAEGVMGMFDGKDPLSNVGSSAEIAEITDTPILLVIDGSGIARSAAAIVKGFQQLSANNTICAVVVNKVGSKGHYELIKQAVEQECEIPVIGYLTRDDRITLPERYAGLVPLLRNEQDPAFELLVEQILQNFDLNTLYNSMGIQKTKPTTDSLFGIKKVAPKVKIAVAKDEAFCFYYKENLQLLQQNGAELIYFSPLKDEVVEEEVDGIYIGGGFPERFAAQLTEQKSSLQWISDQIKKGVPTLAEGGGFMYLADSIEGDDGKQYPMAGIISGKTKMNNRLVALGYRTVTGLNNNYLLKPDLMGRGHVFHYSFFEPNHSHDKAYTIEGRRGKEKAGVLYKNVIASYTHLHFCSNFTLPKRFIEQCLSYKNDVSNE